MRLARCRNLRVGCSSGSKHPWNGRHRRRFAQSGYVLTKVPPVYPVEAKKARIQGKVVLNAIIGKDGTVENLTVVSGPNELQQSAQDAVRQLTYKPFLVDGDPVEVKTTINVIYRLAN